MIVADASWVIALRDPLDAHHANAVAINESIGSETVLLHDVTLAECLVGPARLDVIDAALAALQESFEVVHADADAPRRWAMLRSTTRLRLPDAVVLDTALNSGAHAIATFDERLTTCSTDFSVDIVAPTDGT